MTPVECSSLGNLNDFQNAVNNNSLPSVSWVVPLANNSDHPGQSTWQAGQHYVNSMIRLVEESPEWSSTVMLLLWDDWGAYYDHVTPIQYDQWGEGFRVPLIAISPYSIHGGIVEAPAFNYGTNPAFQGVHQEDLSALLSTIEYNWGLGNLTDRDGYEPNLFYMLNFTQKPLAPLILGDSGVSYPLPPLVMEQSPQTIGQPMASVNALVIPLLRSIGTTTLTIWTAQTSPYHESTAEALSMSGDGDPGD
jgi:phospholipase C